MQYSKLLLDRMTSVPMPFGRRSQLPTSMFQAVDCTAVYPLALDHFHHARGKPAVESYPIVAVTSMDAIPPFAPPFKFGWIEWVDQGTISACAIITFDEQQADGHGDCRPTDLPITTPEYDKFRDGARWVQLVIPFFGIAHDEEAISTLEFCSVFAIAPDGKGLRGFYLHRGELVDPTRADKQPIFPGARLTLGDVSAPGSCQLAVFFEALLTCKNVDRLPVEPPPALSKKRVRRGHLPLVRYHTLRIKIPGTQRFYEPKPKDPNAPPVGLHFVRGHFKTYAAERPLLGRAIGTFYWPPGVRGSLKAGAVGKHYREEAPRV